MSLYPISLDITLDITTKYSAIRHAIIAYWCRQKQVVTLNG